MKTKGLAKLKRSMLANKKVESFRVKPMLKRLDTTEGTFDLINKNFRPVLGQSTTSGLNSLKNSNDSFSIEKMRISQKVEKRLLGNISEDKQNALSSS